jgi:folate-dependent phosphoribosylglycinamide formyltransferase PurN
MQKATKKDKIKEEQKNLLCVAGWLKMVSKEKKDR